MSLLKNQYLLTLVRIFLGGLFIYAAVPKMADPFTFAVSVYNYQMLPGFGVGLVAAGLPWLEMAAGLCLVLGVRVRVSALIITGLLAVFTAAMVINTLRGIDVDCGCFAINRTVGWVAAAQDSLLTLLGIWYVVCGRTFLSLESLFMRKGRG